MRVTAIIPARGKSKGILRKNLREVNSVPLIERCVRTMQSSSVCDRVIVSTEDDEIAGIALSCGAEVHVRPDWLGGDKISSESVLIDACLSCGVRDGILVFAQCTSPLTLPCDVSECVSVVRSNPMAVAVTAVPFHAPVWRGTKGHTHDETKPRQRRQDMPAQWRETGAVYAMRTERFMRSRNRFCGQVWPVYQQAWQGIDIDTDDDLLVADALARKHDPRPDMSTFKLIVFDFDGVITDNRVWTSSDGNESVCCSKEDSTAFYILREAGIKHTVLTHELDRSLNQRLGKLGVDFFATSNRKHTELPSIVDDYGATLKETIYVGNDLPDVGCMRMVGLAVCPADAHPSAKRAAHIVLRRKGGDGAVRELVDMLGVSDV